MAIQCIHVIHKGVNILSLRNSCDLVPSYPACTVILSEIPQAVCIKFGYSLGAELGGDSMVSHRPLCWGLGHIKMVVTGKERSVIE